MKTRYLKHIKLGLRSKYLKFHKFTFLTIGDVKLLQQGYVFIQILCFNFLIMSLIDSIFSLNLAVIDYEDKTKCEFQRKHIKKFGYDSTCPFCCAEVTLDNF